VQGTPLSSKMTEHKDGTEGGGGDREIGGELIFLVQVGATRANNANSGLN